MKVFTDELSNKITTMALYEEVLELMHVYIYISMRI